MEIAGWMFNRSLNCQENGNESLSKRRSGAPGFQTLVYLNLCSVHVLPQTPCDATFVILLFVKILCNLCQANTRKHLGTIFLQQLRLQHVLHSFKTGKHGNFYVALAVGGNGTPWWSPGCTMQRLHCRVLCLCTVDGFLASFGGGWGWYWRYGKDLLQKMD